MSETLPSSQSSAKAKFRVAICGVGVAGLILAITIGKFDPSIPIDLYEAHDSIETAGVGITLRSYDVLKELGLFDAFKQSFSRSIGTMQVTNLRRSDMYQGGYTWYKRVHTLTTSTLHRQQMVAVLEKHLPPSCTVHLRKRLVTYTEVEQQDANLMPPIRLEFADGTTATADVLIGADGIRSVVRKTMFEKASEDKNGDDKANLDRYIEATFTGMKVYRFLIPMETLKEKGPKNLPLTEMTRFHGKGKFLIIYPVANGTMANFEAIVSDPSLTGTHYDGHWVSDATHEEFAEHFAGFEPDARELIKLCGKPSKWALHIVKSLPFCAQKRAVIIGDAAHAMTPHLGSGAGQAMEDAFVLGRLIAHPLTSLSRIPDVLRIYEEVRLKAGSEVANVSVSTGWLSTFMESGFYDGTRKEDDLDENGISAYEKEGLESIKCELERRWNWLDSLGGILPAWEEAKSKLQSLVN